ncbi:glutathione S-transferase family protein [Alsobacter sp. SYSU M60028]|uniref:Glutathione S-transferase family protein n=1 Tax=Alsobacter ponti TaxID=2962936 RepID=A0ABT1L872_9HYPH|nr:glutathione S-transferase family protein [Alsobacter ponti]MCP8937213.1 glutathione S-transferase family protein [Alsobacter ponti]
MLKLVIANKAYSSWSLRPWILMRALDIPFAEDLIPLDTPEFRPRVSAYKAGSTVPILVDGDVTVWESLAIMDYLADRFPEKQVWPADIKARAFARTISAEMHAGFRGLRAACPMNLRKRYEARDRGELVSRDATRVTELWRRAREGYGAQAGGPFLFGAFTAADAMYAPVVTRFHSYGIEVDASLRPYMDAMLNHPAFVEWQEAAMRETWIVAHDEADEPVIGPFR